MQYTVLVYNAYFTYYFIKTKNKLYTPHNLTFLTIDAKKTLHIVSSYFFIVTEQLLVKNKILTTNHIRSKFSKFSKNNSCPAWQILYFLILFNQLSFYI